MKKIWILGAVAWMAAMWSDCTSKQEREEECLIHGTVNPRFNGKKIFLVPIEGPATMETVDSIVIQNGKFEFQSESGEMKVIRMDYRYRSGVEDLLLVMEPGDLNVIIDSISSGKGTPMNDSLQVWKEHTMKYYSEVGPWRKRVREAEKNGDKELLETMKAKVDTLDRAYKRYSRRLADCLEDGPLRRFLDGRFPTSYKKKMPDGTIITIQVEY